jgi:hypothetical protein
MRDLHIEQNGSGESFFRYFKALPESEQRECFEAVTEGVWESMAAYREQLRQRGWERQARRKTHSLIERLPVDSK